MDLYNQYKRINGVRGRDARERNQNIVKREFDNILTNSANSYLVQYYKANDIPFRYFEEENIIIDDGTTGVKNTNKDEKRVMCSMDTCLKVGTYISWREREWLITAEELAPTSAFKKFTLRPCVVRFSMEIAGAIYDFPAVFENLSLQTKFSSDVQIDNVGFEIDSSTEQIIVPTDSILKEIIQVNNRIMLNKEKVFMIKKINNFASEGVSIVSIEQVVENQADNFDKNIADYSPKDEITSSQVENKEITINGDNIIKIGSKRSYTIELFEDDKLNDSEALDISVEAVNEEDIDSLLEKIEISERAISFYAVKNTKNINKKVKIVVVSNDTEDLKTELEVSIKGIM